MPLIVSNVIGSYKHPGADPVVGFGERQTPFQLRARKAGVSFFFGEGGGVFHLPRGTYLPDKKHLKMLLATNSSSPNGPMMKH